MIENGLNKISEFVFKTQARRNVVFVIVLALGVYVNMTYGVH